MRAVLCFLIFVFILQYVLGQRDQLCENSTEITRSCRTQILGEDYVEDGSCKVQYISPEEPSCKESFGDIEYNANIGGVSLKPYLLPVNHQNATSRVSLNRAVLNITFSNIKWKTMKFRFQKSIGKYHVSYCRNIIISNDVTFNDQSVLYYDCYWGIADGSNIGQSHILDFEASKYDVVVNRGRYYFNMPSADMLSPTITEKDWKPFVYIEILTSSQEILTSKMNLHIVPPPAQLQISEYKIEVIWQCENVTKNPKVVKAENVTLKNRIGEVTYNYSMLREPGWYYFSVQPIHEMCELDLERCQTVTSPTIRINVTANKVHENVNICIASITALIVAILFAYYIVLRVGRRYFCKEYRQEIPLPTKVLVVYSTENRLHAACVASFVNYLRSEYFLEVMYDGDISTTTHGDPFIWAQEAFHLASHVVYIVGPAENTNLYNNIYDKPILAHKDVDTLLLSLLKANKVSKCRKDVMNVFFEHSNGPIPIETKHDKVFFLLKDWQKLIAYLSKNLLPKKQLMRTEKGKSFLEDLTRAKKLLSNRNDDVIVKCDMNSGEKKVLL